MISYRQADWQDYIETADDASYILDFTWDQMSAKMIVDVSPMQDNPMAKSNFVYILSSNQFGPEDYMSGSLWVNSEVTSRDKLNYVFERITKDMKRSKVIRDFKYSTDNGTISFTVRPVRK